MTECQGCGAWNDASRTVCVLCGTPLAETDEWDAASDPPPLPPLPDGGLASAMPAWLREPPAAPARTPDGPAAPAVIPPGASTPHLAPLGPRADPRTFLTDDDFPAWLRELASRQAAHPEPTPDGNAAASSSLGPPLWPERPERLASPPTGRAALPTSATPESVTVQAEKDALSALPAAARYERTLWETALLILLFLGIIAAAVWALISNGVFDPFV